MRFLKNLFSYSNKDSQKILIFFGVKIKMTNKKDRLYKRLVELENKVNALEYMQNFYVDISNLPKARGRLRTYQEIQTVFLKIFQGILRKYNVPYWIDFGTLLGAIRHNGFIPWDDDLDISVLRDDYVKLPKIFEKELSAFGFSIRLDSAIKIFWEVPNRKPFFLCDVYPYDKYYKRTADSSEIEELNKSSIICYTEFLKEYNLQESRKFFRLYNEDLFKKIQDKISNLRSKIVMNGKTQIQNGNLFVGPEILPYGVSHSHLFETVFPLKNVNFEGISVCVPNNFDTYLKTLYGNYWLFPKNTNRNHIFESLEVIEKMREYDLEGILATLKGIYSDLVK